MIGKGDFEIEDQSGFNSAVNNPFVATSITVTFKNTGDSGGIVETKV